MLPVWLLGAGSFLGKQWKLLAIGAAALVAVFFILQYRNEVRENAVLRANEAQYKQTILDKDREIGLLNRIAELSESVLVDQARDERLRQEALADLSRPLGSDENEQAPESLKELLRRLTGKVEE